MPELSPTLSLPYLQPAQAQKHVTHNEALRILDAVTQLSVLNTALSDPPGLPNNGDRYIVGPLATGEWAGQENTIAVWAENAWAFYAPDTGWQADVQATGETLRFDGTDWVSPALPALQNLPGVGVNTTADATNKLAVSSDATLLNNAGAGHQLKVNKADATDTASLLFQTGFSGRAEMGTTGSDDFEIKVSPDGSTFHSAAVVDKNSGTLAVQGLASLKANSQAVSSMLFTSGGDGVISAYRTNGTSAQPARTATINSIAGDAITLNTTNAQLFFETVMVGVSYVRIWNTTKTTPQSAWVKASPTNAILEVLDAADIADWLIGETIQVGDPAGYGMSNNVIAVDISPMLINLYGQAFHQSGIMVKSAMLAGSAGDFVSITPSGISGSFVSCAEQGAGNGVTIIPTEVASPISNSNLFGIREIVQSTAGIRLVSIIAVMV